MPEITDNLHMVAAGYEAWADGLQGEFAGKVVARAKSKAPVGTGKLQRGIHEGETGEALSDAPYSLYVDRGTDDTPGTFYWTDATAEAAEHVEDLARRGYDQQGLRPPGSQ